MSNTLFGRVAGAAQPLIIDYQPSQPTGWSRMESPTLGGHTASDDFTYQDIAYTISLLPFGQAGGFPDPVYEAFPGDPTINFRDTLESAWGSYYSFRYLGGVAGFSVESYSVFVNPPVAPIPIITFGGDLYLVYRPEPHSGPVISNEVQFIQVISTNSAGAGSELTSTVNSRQDNPFVGEGGGLTSVNGDLGVSFYCRPQEAIASKAPVSLAPWLMMTEVFMALDTGIKDASGKDIVKILGGVKWGWQVQNGS